MSIGSGVANLPDRHLLSDPQTQAWLEASANRLVAELFDEEGALRRIDALSPEDDGEFARRMVETELGLIADGYDPIADLPAAGRYSHRPRRAAGA